MCHNYRLLGVHPIISGKHHIGVLDLDVTIMSLDRIDANRWRCDLQMFIARGSDISWYWSYLYVPGSLWGWGQGWTISQQIASEVSSRDLKVCLGHSKAVLSDKIFLTANLMLPVHDSWVQECCMIYWRACCTYQDGSGWDHYNQESGQDIKFHLLEDAQCRWAALDTWALVTSQEEHCK